MSQISGVSCFDPAVDSGDILDKVCEGNWLGAGVVRKCGAPLVAMACWSPANDAVAGEPASAPGKGSPSGLSVLCGRLGQGGGTIHGPDGPARAELGNLAATGDAALVGSLNGIFAGASWDAAGRRLTIFTDRCGYRPLYYYFDRSRRLLVFSSRLTGIIRSGVLPVRPNWEACSRFMFFGHCLGDETLFDGVGRVGAGVTLTFDGAGLRFTEHWSPNSLVVDERMSLSSAIEGSGHLIAQAIRRRQEGLTCPPMVCLSGGLDSRMIAAELGKLGCEFATFTTRGFHPVPLDKPWAALVAQRLGVPNTFVDLPDDFVTRCCDQANRLTEYETDLHQWLLPLMESFGPQYTVNYDGLAGDTLNLMMLGDDPFRDMDAFLAAERLSAEQLARKIIAPCGPMKFLSRRLRRVLSYDAAIAGVAKQLAPYEGNRNRLALFTLLNRTRRATSLAPFKILQQKVESLCPYMDNDYFDFAMSIPPEIRIPRCLREDILKAHYPQVADIPMAPNMKWYQARPEDCDGFAFRRQQRQLRWQRVGRFCIRNSWMFNAPRAAARTAHYLLAGGDYMFNDHLAALMEWLAAFFPGGEGLDGSR